jgi:hypothetical protein
VIEPVEITGLDQPGLISRRLVQIGLDKLDQPRGRVIERGLRVIERHLG